MIATGTRGPLRTTDSMSFRRFLLLAVLVTHPASGEPVPGGEVKVERTERALGCPGEQALVQAALAHGTAPPVTSSTPLQLSVQFDGDEHSLRALIRASGAKTGERVLSTEGNDCGKLAEAAAVVIAVLLDIVPPETAVSFEAPAALAPPAAPPAPPPPRPEPTPSLAQPARALPAATVTAAPRPLHALLRVEGALTLGFLGGAFTPAVDAAATLRGRRWEAGLGAMWLASREAPFSKIAGTSVDLSLWLGVAEGCLAFLRSPRGSGDGWFCSRFTAGRLTGAGRGFDHPRTSQAWWAAAGPALAFRLRVTPVLSLRASLNALVTLGDHSFVVDGYGSAFDTPHFSVALGAGPEWSIL